METDSVTFHSCPDCQFLFFRALSNSNLADYYPKFGFKPASLWNIKAPFEVPDEVFMALELADHSLEDVQGVVHYSEAFME